MTHKNSVFQFKNRFILCFLLFSLFLSLFVLFGCGYTLHGKASLPFEAVRIGTIENKTYEPKLQDRLYQALTDEFLRQGIAVAPDAGYMLSGTITHFELNVLSEKSDVAAEYEVVIKGNFILADPSGKKKEFKDIGSPFIVSFGGSGALEELLASKERASEKAIRDMAMQIVGAILF